MRSSIAIDLPFSNIIDILTTVPFLFYVLFYLMTVARLHGLRSVEVEDEGEGGI